jgi:hypothetical protein
LKKELLNLKDEERNALGKYLTARANGIREELEAIDELLNELGKPILEARPVQKPTEKQFNGLTWITVQGKKAPYEQTGDSCEDAHVLYEYLKSNKGFSELFGYKVWIDRNPNLIDRRKKR